MKVLVFGAGSGGQKYYEHVKSDKDITIVAFADNNPEFIGKTIGSIPIVAPPEIKNLDFDKIVISTMTKYAFEILKQLDNMGIDAKDAELFYFSDYYGYDEDTDERVIWLRKFAGRAGNEGIPGSVAECGVHAGFFARFINKYFPDRKLYLFDTFKGFADKDIEAERGFNGNAFDKTISFIGEHSFTYTGAEYVMRHMPHPESCIVKEGYFPETAAGVNDTFCFVNLDMDLYKPMLAGLEFFWDKMVKGGVILLHDYKNSTFPGVEKAVEDFEKGLGHTVNKIEHREFGSLEIIKN